MARGITLHSLKPARSVDEKCCLVRQGLAQWLDHVEDRIPRGEIVIFDSRPCGCLTGLCKVYG